MRVINKSTNSIFSDRVLMPLLSRDRIGMPKESYGSDVNLSPASHTVINIESGLADCVTHFNDQDIFSHVFNFLNFEEVYTFYQSSSLLRFDCVKNNILSPKTKDRWYLQAKNAGSVLGLVGSFLESKINKEENGEYERVFFDWNELKYQLRLYSMSQDGEANNYQAYLDAGGSEIAHKYVSLVFPLSTPFIYNSGSFFHVFSSNGNIGRSLIIFFLSTLGFVMTTAFNPKYNASITSITWIAMLIIVFLPLTCFFHECMASLYGNCQLGNKVMSELVSRYAADMLIYQNLVPAISNEFTDVVFFNEVMSTGYQSRNEQHSAPGTGCSK